MRPPACMKRNRDFLKLLSTSKPSSRRSLVQHASRDQIDTLSEIALNLLNDNIPTRPTQSNRLQQYARQLRHLARRKGSLKGKKALLTRNQRGGFLAALASILAPLAIGLVEKLFK